MKPFYGLRAGRGASTCGVLLITVLSLVDATARGQSSYAAVGWLQEVPVPGIVCPTLGKEILLRATVFTVRMDSADPRLAGRRTVLSDGYFQSDGSAVIYGSAYHEVGTWAGTNFIPAGGMWELEWRGVMQTNCSVQLTQMGYGSGGTIDGLRLEETVVRTNASSLHDPAVPFLYAGT